LSHIRHQLSAKVTCYTQKLSEAKAEMQEELLNNSIINAPLAHPVTSILTGGRKQLTVVASIPVISHLMLRDSQRLQEEK